MFFLYSTQVNNNTLAPILRQVIAFARKHVFSCALCKLKGYYCEICKGSQILYPFDTDSTKRCENCKSVFHMKCFDEKYDRHSCPKCLRMAKKKSQLSWELVGRRKQTLLKYKLMLSTDMGCQWQCNWMTAYWNKVQFSYQLFDATFY